MRTGAYNTRKGVSEKDFTCHAAWSYLSETPFLVLYVTFKSPPYVKG